MWLGAQQEKLAVENKGGNGIDACLLRLGRGGVDTTGVAPVGERGGGFLAVEPGFGHEVEQRVRVADVPGFRPVRVHKPRVHVVVEPLFARELRQLERLPRIGDDVRWRVVGEARGLHHVARPFVHVLRIATAKLLPRDSLGRVLGMKVEREPFEGRSVLPLEPRGPLQGHRAERSDVVAPDPDGQRTHPFTLPIYHRLEG